MLFLLLLVLVVLWGWLITSPFYWRRKGVPTMFPLPVVGNFLPAFFMSADDFFERLYYKFPNDPYVGIHLFSQPTLFVRDPKIILEILEEKFASFSSRGLYLNRERDPVSGGLFQSERNAWKLARIKLSPAFSPAMVKQYVEVTKSPIEKMVNAIDMKLQQNGKGPPEAVIEMLSVSMFFSVDVASSSLFGVDTSIFSEEKNSIFYNVAKDINRTSGYLKMMLSMFSPTLIDLFKFNFFPDNVNSFVTKIVETAMKGRSGDLANQKILIDRLVQSTTSEIDNREKFLIAQGINIWAGAVETTAITLSFILYFLSKNQELQEEVRSKLYTEEGQKLIKAVMHETLRIYPVFRLLTRRCTQKCKLSTGLEVDEGTLIMIPVACLHTDPDIHSQPKDFNIDREYVKGAYLPFGVGPRVCIGMRMALGVTIEILSALLKNYEFTPSDKPLVLEEMTVITAPKGGLYLNVKKISP